MSDVKMRPNLLLLDNHDSFTHNLAQSFWSLGYPLEILRNQHISQSNISWKTWDGLIIGPGPGTPKSSGQLLNFLETALKAELPILGVCLGLQALVEVHGGSLQQAQRICHGKISSIEHFGTSLFSGIPSPFSAARYHSWAADEEKLPSSLTVTARSGDNEIMALNGPGFTAVQFHPESIGTSYGLQLIKNFIFYYVSF